MARTKDFDEDDVLEKAVQVFWHKGYKGTSMQDLVDGLGISRSSLYDTFGDKHALYLRALGRYKQSSGEKLKDILGSDLPAKKMIRRLLKLTSRELLGDEKGRGCFMVNAEVELASHDEALKCLVVNSEQELEQAYFQAISRGQKRGEISGKRDTRALARFMLNTIKGMQVSAKSVRDPGYFEDVIEMAVSML